LPENLQIVFGSKENFDQNRDVFFSRFFCFCADYIFSASDATEKTL